MIASFRARFISRRMHTQWHGLSRTVSAIVGRNYTLQKFQLVCKTYMSCTLTTLTSAVPLVRVTNKHYIEILPGHVRLYHSVTPASLRRSFATAQLCKPSAQTPLHTCAWEREGGKAGRHPSSRQLVMPTHRDEPRCESEGGPGFITCLALSVKHTHAHISTHISCEAHLEWSRPSVLTAEPSPNDDPRWPSRARPSASPRLRTPGWSARLLMAVGDGFGLVTARLAKIWPDVELCLFVLCPPPRPTAAQVDHSVLLLHPAEPSHALDGDHVGLTARGNP